MHKPLLSVLALIAAMLLPGTALAAESGTALKADSIRDQPYADARTTGKFARGDKLQIVAKQGAWLKVQTAKTTGWVRLLSVKRGSIGASGNQTADVLSMASGRSGTGQVVATTGVRGLNEEDLKSAKFNAAEIAAVESYTQSVQQGQKFAAEGKLKAIKFAYLPAPSQSTGSAPSQQGGLK